MPDNFTPERQVFHSFSGQDIFASFSVPGVANSLFGNIQTISISTHRDVAPVRRLGHDAPTTYKKGTRTVSGSLIFIKLHEDEISKFFKDQVTASLLDVRGFQGSDRAPPFNITIQEATEYGPQSRSAELREVTLIDSGQVLSINDVYTEQTYSYVAREYLDFNMENVDNVESPRSVNQIYKAQVLNQ